MAGQQRERVGIPLSLPLNDRSFDLVLLSNWEDQIMYEPKMDVDEDGRSHTAADLAPTTQTSLTNPVNKTLESGDWTQSIIWGPKVPFRDFTQLEFNHEDDVVPEERQPGGQFSCISGPFSNESRTQNGVVQESASVLRLRTEISLTCRTINITNSPKTEAGIASAKPSANSWWNTRTQHKNYNYPS